MLRKPNILIAEDEDVFAGQVQGAFESEGYCVTRARNGREAILAIEKNHFDAGFIDMNMPEMNGLQVIEEAMKIAPELPLVIFTGYATIDSAVKAMQLGAFDFIEKPASLDRLLTTAQNAVKNHQLVLENKWMREDYWQRYAIIGTSPAMQRIYQIIDKVAATSATVLITGESGTGKELIARALHNQSARSHGPFVKLNCAAIPESLIESELFGHKKGAFTGAERNKQGRFEHADGGTLFLDEIGEMSPAAQAKVLRAIETQEFEAVGDETTRTVNVRILCATNRDFPSAVQEGLIRKDLYYRLAEITIHMPPLRERKEDIPLMAEYFRDMFCEEHNRCINPLDSRAIRVLMDYHWPGNVREFKAVMNRLVIFAEANEITATDISEQLMLDKREAIGQSYHESMQHYEQTMIRNALIAHDWQVTETARALKLDRTNLHKKMQKLGIKRID